MTYKIDIYVCHYDLHNELAIMRQILHGHNNSIVRQWSFFNESFLGYSFVLLDNDYYKKYEYLDGMIIRYNVCVI